MRFATASGRPDQSDWQQWFRTYQQEYLKSDGWLSLVGLYWLKQGINTLGSCKNNDHRLPDQAPCHLGQIVVEGKQLELSSDTFVELDGKRVKKARLHVNQSKVRFGRFWFYIIEREKGFAVRLGDNQSPYKQAFKGLSFFDFDPKAVISARFEKAKQPQKIKIATVYGTVREVAVAGWLHFKWQNQAMKLLAVNYGTDQPLGIMFADETNQQSTYGAGRYLDVAWPDKNGTTWIDFNRSYNPPCAYTHFATCPLPPSENRLSIRIEAGARYEQEH